MKKSLISALLLSIALAAPARADTIGGIDFDIPEDWELVTDESENETISQNIYVSGEEVAIVTVQDISDMAELAEACNLMLLKCSDIYNEKEGFYLMSDVSEDDENGLSTVYQECVYYESDEWNYVISLSRNAGDKLLSFIYSAPTIGDRSQMNAFLILANPYIFVE